MSSPVQNDFDRRSMYAPPWARETPQQPESIIEAIEQLRQERAHAAALAVEEAARAEAMPRQLRDRNQRELALERASDAIDIEAAMADTVRASWKPHSLDPVLMPEPPKPRFGGPSLGMVLRLTSAVAVAAGVTLVVAGAVTLSPLNFWAVSDDDSTVAPIVAQAPDLRETPAPLQAVAVAAPAAPPRLAMAVATVPVAAPAPLPSIVPVAPLPPPLAVAMPIRTTPVTPALPSEVLTAFASIDSGPTARAVKTDVMPVVAPMPGLPELRAIERDELASLVNRGELLLLEGDVSSARLMLRRAAEAGDANATLILAGTYDRVELARLKVIGIPPDDAQAKHWYAKAVEFGSAEAVRRLQQFAQR
jgi:hypothetical protein